jgi:hypothetical protein
MINILKTTAIGMAMAGILAVAAVTPSLARVVAHHPGSGYGYGQPVYDGPQSGHAYAPTDDIGGPYSPCYPTLRWQNRC